MIEMDFDQFGFELALFFKKQSHGEPGLSTDSSLMS